MEMSFNLCKFIIEEIEKLSKKLLYSITNKRVQLYYYVLIKNLIDELPDTESEKTRGHGLSLVTLKKELKIFILDYIFPDPANDINCYRGQPSRSKQYILQNIGGIRIHILGEG